MQREDKLFNNPTRLIWKKVILFVLSSSGTSIGKRYARTDELGVPLAITVDSTSSVTVRKRDSKVQIRVAVGEVASIIKEVTDGQSTWKCFINIIHQHLCLTLKRMNGF